MADYGFCYDGTGRQCSGRPQPGTLALRAAVRAVFPGIGDLGIYNCRPTRGGGSLSTHGEGRGWDAACNAFTQRDLGDRVAAELIKNATKLGIQRIIWNRRQWDSRSRAWRGYGGVSPHTDHLHIELCWAAARDIPLTEQYVRSVLKGQVEDMAEVPQEEWEQVRKDVADIKSALFSKNDAKAKEAGGRNQSLYNIVVQIRNFVKPPTVPADDG